MHDTLKASQRDTFLAPLTRFYDRTGAQFPEVTFLHGEVMPEPYRHLLVHHSDMTPRLRDFHRADLTLERLDQVLEEPILSREVVLRRIDNNAPVEFGAIRIYLDQLPTHIATPVREGERPLGGILEQAKFPHRSAPRGYFSTHADALMADTLGADQGIKLFGRCNVLALTSGKIFAEIVEILPPTEAPEA